MKDVITSGTALVLIDVQKGIDQETHWGGNRNNPEAEENIERLLSVWKERKLPVIVVQHDSKESTSPLRPGQVGNALKDIVSGQGDKLIKKSTTSAFAKTDLLPYLQESKIDRLVITGFVTNNSVEATARAAGDLGFETVVVSDATASFNKKGHDGTNYDSDLIHQISLSNLSGEYATILTTQQILNSGSLQP